jgi:hypothetical protein
MATLFSGSIYIHHARSNQASRSQEIIESKSDRTPNSLIDISTNEQYFNYIHYENMLTQTITSVGKNVALVIGPWSAVI